MKKRGMSASKKRELGFQLILLAWPVVQFFIFYIVVNFNSFRMAFNFEDTSNFFLYFKNCFSGEGVNYVKAAGISVLLFLIVHIITVPLGLIFSYYISKKFFGHKFFKFILFIPSIISATVMIAIFMKFASTDLRYFVMQSTHEDFELVSYLPDKLVGSYAVVIAFSIFISFGTTTLLYSNRMSEVSSEIVEAARLDGVNRFQEFIHITLPQVFPTLTTMLVTGVACVFTNQFNLFTFLGAKLLSNSNAPLGYLIFGNVSTFDLTSTDIGSNIPPIFREMAALGIVATLVTIPLVFGFKYLMERFGPSEK